jgi:hypothetical protein
MSRYGASKSLNEIYHTWFADGSAKWDNVITSDYGPAPGYLAGGPNKDFGWDGCCPSDCDSGPGWSNNDKCIAEPIPVGEPPAKMYKEFNTSWPLNSWQITEPSNGYQLSYIRLLSKFVERGGAVPVKNQREIRHFEIAQTKNGLNATLKASAVVEIYGLSGKLISRSALAPGVHSISLGHLPRGMYIVKIEQRTLRVPVM